MNRIYSVLTAVIIFATCCCLYSCKQKKEIIPSAEFAPYISAYTGGSISHNSTILVEFMEDQPESVWKGDTDETLFSFSPSLKGAAHWVNGKTIEFVPERGELKPGTMYNVAFALEKVMSIDKKLSKFEFSFSVDELTFKVVARPIEIQLENTVVVRGEITFNEMISLEAVKKMFEAKVGDKKLEITVDGSDNDRVFQFFVKDIARTDSHQQLSIIVDGTSGGIKHKETLSVSIPVKNKFKLHEYEIVNTPEYGLRLTFSDIVSESQDLRGMITLKGVPNYTTQVQSNQVMVYFAHTSKMKELIVIVDEGLKNQMGEALGDTEELTISLEPLKPQVEIQSSGVIMPSSGKVVLPFRAAALHAVDLQIVRIFENNVLMFLQNNKLSKGASNQLRRAGRLVYKNTLRLDADPAKDITTWESYSLDLTGLVKQQPGAIYRIELSFKKEYASYECEDEEVRNNALNGATDLRRMLAGEWSVSYEEDEYWDIPDYYYYDGYDEDWEYYDSSNLGNPCDPYYYNNTGRRARTNVLASNLGMIVKSNTNNTTWVAVTNILDTKPVAGAKVTAYNYQLQPITTATTDENGFTVLSMKNKPFILVAESGKDKAYLRTVDGEENMLSRFDVGGVDMNKGLKGYVYGERGVWRPGDTLHMAFMLEDREKKIPANHPVSFEIYNPQGQFSQKMISTNGLNGLYTFSVPTKADDPTGLWNAYIKVGGAMFHKSIRIETIKPNRLKINLELPAIIDASSGVASVKLHSQWLTGAVARNLDTKLELALSKVYTQFKGYENYQFNNPATKFSSSKAEIFDGKLNESGDYKFEMKVPTAKSAPGMLNATITCRVFEPGGDASIYSQSMPFSPHPAYVGINFNRKSDGQPFFVDEDHTFDVVMLSPDGKPVNSSNIEYKIYRIGWGWWWERANETFESYINNTSYTPLFSGKVDMVNGKGQIKFRIDFPSWGRYLVYVKDMSGGHATGGTILVDWPSWRGRSNKEDPDGIKMLAFSLDKESYNVGDDVAVNIPATVSDSRALVALENGNEVLMREWVNLKAGSDTKYVFRTSEKMAPNAYVHISLLQPHASTVDMPIRLYGVMPVFVSNKESVLTPVITMANVLKPEKEFEVKIKEQNGKPMTYTLAIVDDGLLDITSFKTPDPWNTFYAREALGIRTWDLFDNVMGAYGGKYGSLFSVGGDDEISSSSSPKANRFKPVVLYVGPVTLNAGEEKVHSLHLPSYVGSVRVMVIAGQDGKYGRADKTVTVRSPLMLLSSLPRVLSTDEKISLPVNVFAMEENVKNVTVKVETTGKLKAADGNSKSIVFSAPGDEVVYFPMQTGMETGIETVTITATGGGHTSKEIIEIDVRNPNPPTIVFEDKILEKGQAAELSYALNGVSEGNWVKVEMSRIPTIDLSRHMDILHFYYHNCTEQIASKAMPLLYLSEFKDLDEDEVRRIKVVVPEAINMLYGRQSSDGSFAYWDWYDYYSRILRNEWITSYVGSFLLIAKERGYNVNSNVINKWINYQRNTAQNWRPGGYSDYRYSYYQSDLMQAYRLYTLAMAGVPEIGAMNRMKEYKGISLQAQWMLASAYAISGKQDAAKEVVFNASMDVVSYSYNNSTYGSPERDDAIILEALILMNRNEDAFRQARKVSKNLSRGGYLSTQTIAYSMIAMGQFASKTSGKLDFEWYLNGMKQTKVNTRKAVYQTQIPTKPSEGKVKVENAEEGTLYVSVATKTCPVIDTLPAISENLKIDISYTDMNGSTVDASNLKQGTDFYATIRVSNISGRDNYSDIALTHIIPSGWEVYNERMVAASRAENDDHDSQSNVFTYQDIRDDRALTYFDLKVGKYKEIKMRLQASYIGEFVFPAIQCEAMYDPSARARTTASRVTVSK